LPTRRRRRYRVLQHRLKTTKTCVVLYDPESKKVVDRHEFGFKADVCAVSNGKALIADEDGVQFYCLSSGKMLTSISANVVESDPSATGRTETKNYRLAKFDSNPERRQFVVFTQDLSSFQGPML
jgi:hypothetical protein